MAAGEPVLLSLYVYAPLSGPPIFFAIAYGISAAFHTWQCYRYQAFKVAGWHVLCACLLTIGYAVREYGTHNYTYSFTDDTALITFIMSQICIYICPPLLELANYDVLARTFYYVPHCAPIPASRVFVIFGGLMALVEAINAVGVALATNVGSSNQSLGSTLIKVVLVIQLVVILIFVCISGLFHRKCLQLGVLVKNVRTLLTTLYLSMSLIFIRCIYRLVEHTDNTKVDFTDIESMRTLSPILRYEAFFFVFEASLILVNSILWNVWHPGRFLPKDRKLHLAPDGSEVMGEADNDNRPFLAKVAHVLTFGLLFRKKKKQTGEFEELTDYSTPSRTNPTLLPVPGRDA